MVFVVMFILGPIHDSPEKGHSATETRSTQRKNQCATQSCSAANVRDMDFLTDTSRISVPSVPLWRERIGRCWSRNGQHWHLSSPPVWSELGTRIQQFKRCQNVIFQGLHEATAALSIARTTLQYPVQRQRLPVSACWISSWLGRGISDSSPAADMISPGVQ